MVWSPARVGYGSVRSTLSLFDLAYFIFHTGEKEDFSDCVDYAADLQRGNPFQKFQTFQLFQLFKSQRALA
jgi:hypothetical protein